MTVKKKFEMEDLDCAVCAVKMETAIRKIAGVKNAGVNFLTQKMFIEAEEEDFPDIVPQMLKAVKKVDSHCNVLVK